MSQKTNCNVQCSHAYGTGSISNYHRDSISVSQRKVKWFSRQWCYWQSVSSTTTASQFPWRQSQFPVMISCHTNLSCQHIQAARIICQQLHIILHRQWFLFIYSCYFFPLNYSSQPPTNSTRYLDLHSLQLSTISQLAHTVFTCSACTDTHSTRGNHVYFEPSTCLDPHVLVSRLLCWCTCYLYSKPYTLLNQLEPAIINMLYNKWSIDL